MALEVAQKQLQESQRQVEEGKALHQKLLGIISEQAETIAELKREVMEAREVQERDVSVRGDGEEQEDDLQPDHPTLARFPSSLSSHTGGIELAGRMDSLFDAVSAAVSPRYR